MSRTITNHARQQVQSSQVQDVILVVLDITHPGSDTVPATNIRVVNNNESITWDGNLYEAASFKFTPPSQEEGEASAARLSISNIDRRIVEVVRSINSSPKVEANIVFVRYDDTVPAVEREAGPWTFDLSQVSYNAKTVTGTLSFNFKPKQTLSTVRVSFNNFPGLVQVQ